MSDITFIKAQGGLNIQGPSQDQISGMIFYVNTYPVGFSGISNSIQELFSPVDAITLGINSTSYPIEYYQISEFFRINPNAPLYVNCATGYTGTFEEVYNTQIFSDGVIRQIGIFDTHALTTGMTSIGAIQTQCTSLETIHMPLSVVYGCNTTGFTLTNLPNLRSLTSHDVSVVIGQDGSADGLYLYTTLGISVPAVGACLGSVSLAKVSESIGWVNKFNIKNEGTLEYDTPAFGNGQLYKNQTTALLSQLESRGYIYIKKFVGTTGSYWESSPTSVVSTNDYSSIELNRTIDKAVRGVYISLLPFINGPLQIDPITGKLASITVKELETAGGNSLTSMVSAQEINGYKVTVDPNQNVLSTGITNVVIAISPIGVNKEIVVTIGFQSSI